jgi:hypothetical protein
VTKILVFNELAPDFRGFACCDLYIQYIELGGTKCQLDFLLFEGVRWFWGLTCDFWAENAEKINARARTTAKTKAID